MVAPGSVRVVFMGTSDFAVPVLESLVRGGYQVVGVVTQPPRPAGRGRRPSLPPAMEAAVRLGLPILTPERLGAPEAVGEVASLQPDLIVVAAYAQFLPRSVLDMPPHGCINIHGSLLPRWRGASPIQAAILAGDEFTGVTVMMMVSAMDAGPILGQGLTRIEDSDSAPNLEHRLSTMGAALLISLLPCYLNGTLTPVPQDDSQASYCSLVHKEDGRIDWLKPAVEIWRANRAYKPWPGTYTYWNGRMLKVVSGWPEPGPLPTMAPGTVFQRDAGKEIAVATGSGALRLGEVALEGGRTMGVREFIAGHREFVGSRLG